MTIWQIDLKIRPMLHQILERLGEKATPEIIKALAQVEAAVDNLKSVIEKSQQKSQPINKLFSSPCSMDETKPAK
jgi:hypothetical protein